MFSSDPLKIRFSDAFRRIKRGHWEEKGSPIEQVNNAIVLFNSFLANILILYPLFSESIKWEL